MIYTKQIDITLVDTDTGVVLGKAKKRVRLSDTPLTPLDGNKFLGLWIGCFLRGFKQYNNISMQISATDYTPDIQLSFDNPF